MFSLPAAAAGESRLYFPVVSSTHPRVAQEASWSVVTENSISSIHLEWKSAFS